jgi:hypothetical protein
LGLVVLLLQVGLKEGFGGFLDVDGVVVVIVSVGCAAVIVCVVMGFVVDDVFIVSFKEL